MPDSARSASLPHTSLAVYAKLGIASADTEMSNIRTTMEIRHILRHLILSRSGNSALVDDSVVCPESTTCAAGTVARGEQCPKYICARAWWPV